MMFLHFQRFQNFRSAVFSFFATNFHLFSPTMPFETPILLACELSGKESRHYILLLVIVRSRGCPVQYWGITLNEKTCNWWSLILDNSRGRKSHLIQRPWNKFLAWAWSSESSLKAWGAGRSSTVCSTAETETVGTGSKPQPATGETGTRSARLAGVGLQGEEGGETCSTSSFSSGVEVASDTLSGSSTWTGSKGGERRAQACLHFLATWPDWRQGRHIKAIFR